MFPFNKEAAQGGHHILGGEGRWISWKGPPLSEEREILGRWCMEGSRCSGKQSPTPGS